MHRYTYNKIVIMIGYNFRLVFYLNHRNRCVIILICHRQRLRNRKPKIKKYIYYLNQRHKTDVPNVIKNFHRIYEKIVVFMIVYNFIPVIKI